MAAILLSVRVFRSLDTTLTIADTSSSLLFCKSPAQTTINCTAITLVFTDSCYYAIADTFLSITETN